MRLSAFPKRNHPVSVERATKSALAIEGVIGQPAALNKSYTISPAAAALASTSWTSPRPSPVKWWSITSTFLGGASCWNHISSPGNWTRLLVSTTISKSHSRQGSSISCSLLKSLPRTGTFSSNKSADQEAGGDKKSGKTFLPCAKRASMRARIHPQASPSGRMWVVIAIWEDPSSSWIAFWKSTSEIRLFCFGTIMVINR